MRRSSPFLERRERGTGKEKIVMNWRRLAPGAVSAS